MPEVFFVRGYMRSGTNWLGRILNLHPDIKSHGEFHFEHFGLAKTRIDKSVSCFVLEGRKQELDKQYYDFIRRLVIQFCGTDYKFVGERTPIGLQAVLVPNSKYLWIHRAGQDVVVSWFKHIIKIASKNKDNIHRYRDLASHPEMIDKVKKVVADKNYFDKNNLELLDCEDYFRLIASKWNARIVNDKRFIELTKTKTELNIDVLEIPYEKLHADTDNERAKIYSFLGADPSIANPLDTETLPGFSKTILPNQSRGVVGNWVKYFNQSHARWFEEEASEALELLGYPSIKTSMLEI